MKTETALPTPAGELAISDPVLQRARMTRDRRFDGRFFIGVVTTGIYCRPVCPVHPPKERNVRYFKSAAAAADAGLRPCLRCRPETAPGSPAWNGTLATVHRGLRLIAEGALDGASVEELAARLGVGERHLRRLFSQHLGTTPTQVARTHRLQFAKRLLDSTRLTMPEIASAAGFGSVRRLNSVFRETYGRSPRELRPTKERRRRSEDPSEDLCELELELSFRPPYEWRALLDFLRLRAIPGVERVTDERYVRSVRTERGVGVIEALLSKGSRSADGEVVVLRARVPSALDLTSVVQRAKAFFDLDADPREIEGVLSADSRLAAIARRFRGTRAPGAWDGFELAVRAVLGQQVTVRGATTLCGRVVEAYGEPLPPALLASGLTHSFPRADALLRLDGSRLGLTTKRAECLRGLARAHSSGRLDLTAGADVAEQTEELMALPGIGPWTASYVALRALRDPDALLAGDLVLRKAVARLWELPELPSARRVEELAESWRPFRAYASLLLWRWWAKVSTD